MTFAILFLNMKKLITSIATQTYEINKSKFICYLAPYHEFQTLMEKLKSEHPKARHFVYAYRYINEFDQIVENQSDDGEPKGSSGPPSLAVLRGQELVETVAIVIRYFGGVKLGVGGLIRAYGKSINLAFDFAEKEGLLEPYLKTKAQTYAIHLQKLGSFEHFIKDLKVQRIEKNFESLFCHLTIHAPEDVHASIDDYLTK